MKIAVNVNAYKPTQMLQGHSNSISGIAPLPHNASPNQLITVSWDNQIRVWNAKTGTVIKALEDCHSGWINCVAMCHDGTIVTGGDEKAIKHWDLETGKCIKVIRDAHRYALHSLAHLRDGRLASGGYEMLNVWDLKTGFRQLTLGGHKDVIRAILQLQNNQVATASSDKSIRIWDLSSSIYYFPAANISASRCKKVLKEHTNGVFCLAQLGNGILASGSEDRTIRLWDLKAEVGKECVRVLTGHKGSVFALCLLSDGATLISGGSDHSVRMWDTFTGNCLRVFEDLHSNDVSSLSLLSDGSTIASGSWDGTVRLLTVDPSLVSDEGSTTTEESSRG
jgi:WD40 repeat protein